MVYNIIKEYIFLVLLLLNMVLAVNISNITYKDLGFMEIGDKVKENGKTIKLIAVGEGKVVVDVDGTIKSVEEEGVVSGVEIRVDSIYTNPSRAILNIYVPFNCGNGKCEEKENSGVCCTDCNCTRSSETCTSNQCVDPSLNKCEGNSDCEDGDKCTKDICDGAPAECRFEVITICKKGDGCCPEGCTFLEDGDCEKPDQCILDEHCDDNNPCTSDLCLGNGRKKCYYNYTKGDCNLNGRCVNKGKINKKDKTYCVEHEWQSQREDGENCEKHYECMNYCYENICKKLSFFKRVLAFFHLL